MEEHNRSLVAARAGNLGRGPESVVLRAWPFANERGACGHHHHLDPGFGTDIRGSSEAREPHGSQGSRYDHRSFGRHCDSTFEERSLRGNTARRRLRLFVGSRLRDFYGEEQTIHATAYGLDRYDHCVCFGAVALAPMTIRMCSRFDLAKVSAAAWFSLIYMA